PPSPSATPESRSPATGEPPAATTPPASQGAAGLPVSPPAPGASPGASPAQGQSPQGRLANLPVLFEPNQGQTDPSVSFVPRARGETVFLSATEATLVVPHAGAPATPSELDPRGRGQGPPATRPVDVVRLQLVGGNPAAQGIGEDLQA